MEKQLKKEAMKNMYHETIYGKIKRLRIESMKCDLADGCYHVEFVDCTGDTYKKMVWRAGLLRYLEETSRLYCQKPELREQIAKNHAIRIAISQYENSLLP